MALNFTLSKTNEEVRNQMRESRSCRVCNLNQDEYDHLHNNTPLHRFNFLLFEWFTYRKALVKDRHGVNITVNLQKENGYVYDIIGNPNQGTTTLKIDLPMFMSHHNTVNFECKVVNSRKDPIFFTSCYILHSYSLFSLHDPNNNLADGRVFKLQPGAEYTLIIRFSSANEVLIGAYKIPVSFNFQTTGKSVDAFTIVRSINISVGEESAKGEDSEKSPFKGNDWMPNVRIHQPTKSWFQTDHYRIPDIFLRCIKYGMQEWHHMSVDEHHILMQLRRLVEPGHVTKNNYREFWQVVLWLEEMGQTLGLQKYNMENVKLTSIDAGLLELVVPGLAEKRPSVIAGDFIDLRIHEDHTGYRGVIKRVNDKTVEIADVDETFIMMIECNPDIEIDVRFVLSRLRFDRMHLGVDQVCMNGKLSNVFPEMSLRKKIVPEVRRINDAEFYNQRIVTNPEQKTAVHKILNATSDSAPYIVFGPPGTGKTVTIVEAILQVKRKTNYNILVCAPANAACDMLTEKLTRYCKKEELLRIMSETVDRNAVPESIIPYSNYQSDGGFRRVVAEELKRYRIVVTTLILVGRYAKMYWPDVVFVDEAAQACEPEVACALGMVAEGGRVVLAGDPRQLGPSVSSSVAKKYGLDVSLLERLMELELYRSQDPNYITMLRQNFRSHSTILRLPNELFYSGQLQAMSAGAENDPLAQVCVYERIQGMLVNTKKKNKGAKRRGNAIEFCSVLSKESRQGRSPSYYNNKEMILVLKYVQALVALQFADDEDKVLPEQIGVVTPYIRQVYKVRDILKNNNLEGVEVGTTETFQGREKRAIIITTVRAQKDLLLYDKQYNLGFVRNEKRFNVALTRAMSKLIVIGCAHVLGTDKNWLRYIELSEDVGSFFGAPYARRTKEVIDDITERFRKVKLIDDQQGRR